MDKFQLCSNMEGIEISEMEASKPLRGGKLSMEYYSFMLAFLGILFTILMAIWGTYSLKTNKRKIRIRMFGFLVILIVIFVICTISYVRKKEGIIEKNNELLMEEYYTLYSTGDYVEAIKKLDNLKTEVKNDEDELYMIFYNEAICYTKIGFLEANNEYLEKAIKILYSIKQKETKYSEESNRTINLLLGEIFLQLNEPVYDSAMLSIVDELEEIVKNGIHKAEIDNEEIDLIYYFLGSFYYKQFEKLNNVEYLLQAREYFYKGTNNHILKVDNSEEYALFYYMLENAADCYYKIGVNEFETEKKINNLEQALDIYTYLLDNVDAIKNIVDYLRYEKKLGRCLITVGGFKNDFDCINQGTEMLKHIIYFEDEDFDDVIVGSGYFYIMYGKYNQEDIKILFEKYDRLLEKYNTKDDITAIIEVYKDMAMSYYWLSKKTSDIEYYNKGLEIVRLLDDQYYPIVNELNKFAIDVLKKQYSLD